MAWVVFFGGVDCVEDGCEGGGDEGEERGGEGVEEEGSKAQDVNEVILYQG